MTIMKQTQCVTFKHNELRLLKQYSNIKVNWRVLRRQERQCNCTHVVVARGFPLTQLAIYVLVLRTKLFSPLSVLYYYCNFFFSWWILSLGRGCCFHSFSTLRTTKSLNAKYFYETNACKKDDEILAKIDAPARQILLYVYWIPMMRAITL